MLYWLNFVDIHTDNPNQTYTCTFKKHPRTVYIQDITCMEHSTQKKNYTFKKQYTSLTYTERTSVAHITHRFPFTQLRSTLAYIAHHYHKHVSSFNAQSDRDLKDRCAQSIIHKGKILRPLKVACLSLSLCVGLHAGFLCPCYLISGIWVSAWRVRERIRLNSPRRSETLVWFIIMAVQQQTTGDKLYRRQASHYLRCVWVRGGCLHMQEKCPHFLIPRLLFFFLQSGDVWKTTPTELMLIYFWGLKKLTIATDLLCLCKSVRQCKTIHLSTALHLNATYVKIIDWISNDSPTSASIYFILFYLISFYFPVSSFTPAYYPFLVYQPD